jgi:hypothetical protein
MKLTSLYLTCLVSMGISSAAYGQILYNGGTYSQAFNGLASSGNNNVWANDSTVSGWYAGQTNTPPGTFDNFYSANAGNSTRALFSYGSAPADRALGVRANAIGGGPVFMAVGAFFENNTGSTLGQFTVTYDGEQWNSTGAVARDLAFEYSFNALSVNDAGATWTSVSALNFTSPVLTGVGAIDGNTVGLVPNITATVPVTWTVGSDLWIRWRLTTAGTNQGLAIDNVNFSALPIPEPSTAMMLVGGISMAFWMRRFRRLASFFF